MNDLLRGERLQIMLTKEELEALDGWRFAKRMPSRAAAIRELLKRFLAPDLVFILDILLSFEAAGRIRSPLC